MKIGTALTWSGAMKSARHEEVIHEASSRIQDLQNWSGCTQDSRPWKVFAFELAVDIAILSIDGVEQPRGVGDHGRIALQILAGVADQKVEQQQAAALGAHRGAPRMISAQSFFHFASSSRTTAGSTNLSGSFCAGSATRRLAGT